MFTDELIGREEEIIRLDRCLAEERPQLVIVYGRRRVGKTYLINQYFNGRFDFKLTGTFNAKKEVQLQNFTNELMRHTKTPYDIPKDWTQAFTLLREYLAALPQNEKHVVFFDEMPWLDTQKSQFLMAFEYFWNDFGCTLKNLVFIVCGSATSWMEDKISKNKGGLFHRQTCSIYLKPFTLLQTEQYLQSRAIEWSRHEIAACYMVLGGIPFYLSLLRSDLSPNANIDNLFFRKRAELWDEFDHLYQTLFSNSSQYIKVVETLSKKRGGLTRTELVKQSKMSDNGTLTKILTDLSVSDFVRPYSFYGNKKQETRYQVTDYYSLFYFRFIKDYMGRDESFWSHSYENPARRTWEGLTFELLCMDHVPQIKRKLSIGGVLSEESTWFARPSEKTGGLRTGAQIDLLIDRQDHVINICEIKYSVNEYVITKEYQESLRNKIEAFRVSTKTRKTLQITMITTYGIKPNKYSNMVSNQVVLDDLFYS